MAVSDPSTADNAAICHAIKHGIPSAVRKFGVDYRVVYRALKQRGIRPPTRRAIHDDGLAAACKYASPDVDWTQQMIAEAMGISPQAVRQITDRALKKFRRELEKRLSPGDLEALKEML